MKKLFLVFLILVPGKILTGQGAYLTGPYAGELQNSTITLSAQAGNMVTGQITGENLQLLHIIFAVNENNGTGLTSIYQDNFKIFPNPFQAEINVESDLKSTHRMMIFNMVGIKVYDKLFTSSVIDLSQLPPGVFLLKLFDKSDLELASFRIIKQ